MRNVFSKLLFATATAFLCSCGGSGSQQSGTKVSAENNDSSLIKRADGTVIKKGGYIRPTSKSKAPMYKASMSSNELPKRVDLRPYMSPIESQGELGSCTANAAAGVYEYLMRRLHNNSSFEVSRLFLYYNTRVLMGTEGEDSGAYEEAVIQSLLQDGVCDERTYPYVESRFTQTPNDNCYDEAQNHKIGRYECVGNDLDAWRSALAEGYPIFFGITVFPSFMNPRNGRISMPRSGEPEDGGHAMCCVGYSDPDRVFIVRNSWGTQWGDRGYCYIPYDYICNDKYNSGDNWVIYDLNTISREDADDAWSDDEESLFVEYEDEFSQMDDDTWNNMCDELGDYDIVYRLGAFYNMPCWGDEEMSREEYKAAVLKLNDLMKLFRLTYSAKKVFKNCEALWEEDGFVEETAEILGRYLSEGARAKIAADMFEIVEADGEATDEEKLLVVGLVGDWINAELAEQYGLMDIEIDDEEDEEEYYDDYENDDFDDYDEI
jgi:C1A family cysteine protease